MRTRWKVGAAVASVLVAAASAVGLGVATGVPTAPPSHSTSPRASHSPTARPRHLVVAFGDSVTSGAACSCDPFPAVYGSLLQRRTGGPVAVRNYGVNGLDTDGLLTQLEQAGVVDAARRADVFLVTIGANDFGRLHDQVVAGSCTLTNGADCVSDEISSLREHLSSVLSRIRGLRRGRPTSVLVTGYWNVFEDGDVARRTFGEAGLAASIRLTQRVNGAIRAVATSAGADYVDLFAPFEREGRDVDSLMAADGDHPNAAGHELIARTLLSAGLPHLR